MAQLPQQGYVPSKIQEFNRRASQELTASPLQGGSPRRDAASQQSQNAKESSPQKIQNDQNQQKMPNVQEQHHQQQQQHQPTNGSPYGKSHSSAVAMAAQALQQHYGSPRPTHFEMGPRGMEYSPHRNNYGQEYSPHRGSREFPPQRSTSIHGHEMTNAPMKGQEMYHRSMQMHGQSSMSRIPQSHHDVYTRHEYYPHMGHTGFSPPRPSRFSSQEYLNSPRCQEAYPGRMLQGEYGNSRAHEYRQRRRSSQDLQSIGHEPTVPGTYYLEWNQFYN